MGQMDRKKDEQPENILPSPATLAWPGVILTHIITAQVNSTKKSLRQATNVCGRQTVDSCSVRRNNRPAARCWH